MPRVCLPTDVVWNFWHCVWHKNYLFQFFLFISFRFVRPVATAISAIVAGIFDDEKWPETVIFVRSENTRYTRTHVIIWSTQLPALYKHPLEQNIKCECWIPSLLELVVAYARLYAVHINRPSIIKIKLLVLIPPPPRPPPRPPPSPFPFPPTVIIVCRCCCFLLSTFCLHFFLRTVVS